MSDIQIETSNHGGLWVAVVRTNSGRLEFLCGEGETADERQLAFLKEFMSTGDHLDEIRRSAFRLSVLWQPIRLAVNDQGRMGAQFRNRITGRQAGMFFADEHSTYKKQLSDIDA